ncbi:MAG: hydroxyacid dehydrogenase [Acidobacteria bacterium]|nr:hydroxyacid dehydrogenase [Acidobacteriota bacterium]
MKIAFLEVKDWERAYLAEQLADCALHFSHERVSEADWPALATFDCVSPFIYSRLDRNTLTALPGLRFIATRSTGFDHIDTGYCRERGIGVANVPIYGEYTVAEHTFALILSLSRNVHKSWKHVVEGQIELANLTGFDLKDKTLGVIGAGKIGLHVIKIARGFGMRVLAFDLRQDSFLEELLGFSYVPLEALLAESDIVTLHVPYTPATRHFINRERLSQMKRGALLINTARGQLVDTDALMEALDEGRLAGAGLDVIEGEELITEEKALLHGAQPAEAFRAIVRNNLLLKRDNVVFTPHNAFNSREALLRILDTTVANLRAWQRGESLNRVV